MAPRAVGAEKVIEPVKMREIGRENAENFQLKPAHPQDYGHQANRQKHTGGKAVDIVLTERHGEIAQQKSQTVAMALHTLRYRSQFVTGLAFLLGYFTLALRPHNVYSLSAGVFLAI